MRILLILLFLAICFPSDAAEPKQPVRFGDSGFLPSVGDGYQGRLFRLSQDYPSILPDKSKLPEFLKIDFQESWREYVMAARDYCFDGNIVSCEPE